MTTGRGLQVGEAVLGGGVVALGIFIAVETARLQVGPAHAAIGPRLFPALVATGLIVVGAAVLWEALRGRIAHEQGWELDGTAVALVSAGLLALILLVERAGWVISAAILFVLAARAFGSRRLVADAAIGLVLAGLTFVLFNYGLDLGLPEGEVWEGLAPAG